MLLITEPDVMYFGKKLTLFLTYMMNETGKQSSLL